MAETEQIFDDLFRRTLDCVTELRRRDLDANAALEDARKKIAYYEALVAEAPDGLEQRNAALAADLAESRQEAADLRRRLAAVLARYHTAVQQIVEALATARDIAAAPAMPDVSHQFGRPFAGEDSAIGENEV